MTLTDHIALWALIFSLVSLAWNILRDLFLDKVKVEFWLSAGEQGNIKDSDTGLFSDAHSSDGPISSPKMLLTIINTGRRHVYINKVGGELKEGKKKMLFMAVAGLPRKLEPYEVFSTISEIPDALLRDIPTGNIKDLWVEDTAGKKWKLNGRGWERLKKTITLIITANSVSRV